MGFYYIHCEGIQWGAIIHIVKVFNEVLLYTLERYSMRFYYIHWEGIQWGSIIYIVKVFNGVLLYTLGRYSMGFLNTL